MTHTVTEHPTPCAPLLTHTCTSRTRPCLLNIETKENICILSRPTSFDCSSAAVGNNAQALLINQGERIPLRGKLKGATGRAIYRLTDWLIEWLAAVCCGPCILSYSAAFRSKDTLERPGKCYKSLHNTFFTHFADYPRYASVRVRYQPEVSAWGR